MGEAAIKFEPYGGRQNIVIVHGEVYPVDPDDILSPREPSIMYGDPDDIDAELQDMAGFSDDDAEPSDHNIFDMLVPGCPARPEGMSCEPAGPMFRCRHCGGR